MVNVDPRNTQVGLLHIPPHLALPGEFDVVDLLDGDSYSWRTGENYVRLDPGERVAHVMRVHP